MQSLSTELRGVIESRLRSANPREILVIASALCAQEFEVPGTIHARGPQPLVEPPNGARYVVDGDAVKDGRTGLVWTRQNVGGKRLTWSDAKAACTAARTGDCDDWRLPTVQELLTLVDYSRTNPAIDTSAFECDPEWYWTSAPAASSSACAWIVDFDGGCSSWARQDYEYHVRAVRSGQLIGTFA
jgi:hypothetical protein